MGQIDTAEVHRLRKCPHGYCLNSCCRQIHTGHICTAECLLGYLRHIGQFIFLMVHISHASAFQAFNYFYFLSLSVQSVNDGIHTVKTRIVLKVYPAELFASVKRTNSNLRNRRGKIHIRKIVAPHKSMLLNGLRSGSVGSFLEKNTCQILTAGKSPRSFLNFQGSVRIRILFAPCNRFQAVGRHRPCGIRPLALLANQPFLHGLDTLGNYKVQHCVNHISLLFGHGIGRRFICAVCSLHCIHIFFSQKFDILVPGRFITAQFLQRRKIHQFTQTRRRIILYLQISGPAAVIGYIACRLAAVIVSAVLTHGIPIRRKVKRNRSGKTQLLRRRIIGIRFHIAAAVMRSTVLRLKRVLPYLNILSALQTIGIKHYICQIMTSLKRPCADGSYRIGYNYGLQITVIADHVCIESLDVMRPDLLRYG